MKAAGGLGPMTVTAVWERETVIETLKKGKDEWNVYRSRSEWGPVDLCNEDLSGLDLEGYDLMRDDLEAADMTVSVIKGTDMRGANLKDAVIKGTGIDRDRFDNISMARAI